MVITNMKILALLGKNCGMIAALALKEHIIKAVVYDPTTKLTCSILNIPTTTLDDAGDDYDVLFCVHGRDIVPPEILNTKTCVNVHPCLSKYKGADPIGRFLDHGDRTASIGSHYMTEKVDEGPLIYEKWITLKDPIRNRTEVYNQLYVHYADVILKTMAIVSNTTHYIV